MNINNDDIIKIQSGVGHFEIVPMGRTYKSEAPYEQMLHVRFVPKSELDSSVTAGLVEALVKQIETCFKSSELGVAKAVDKVIEEDEGRALIKIKFTPRPDVTTDHIMAALGRDLDVQTITGDHSRRLYEHMILKREIKEAAGSLGPITINGETITPNALADMLVGKVAQLRSQREIQ